MPPKKKDKKKVIKKVNKKTTSTNKNTNINNNKVIVNVNTTTKRKSAPRKPKQSLYDKLESQRGQLQPQNNQSPPIHYQQPLTVGGSENKLIERLEKQMEMMRQFREENQAPAKARKVRSDKGIPRGSSLGPDVYPEPLLSDAIGTRINNKKGGGGGGGHGYQSDDDRSATGQQTLMSMFSPAMTRSRSGANR